MEKLSWAVEHWTPLIDSKTGDSEHSFDYIERIDFIQEQSNQISEDLWFNPWICHGSRARDRDNHVTNGQGSGSFPPEYCKGELTPTGDLIAGAHANSIVVKENSLQIDVSFPRIWVSQTALSIQHS